MSTLFVVDDNEIDKRIMKFTLVKYPAFDYVLYFDGGLPLINYLKEHKNDYNNIPDTVFLDLRMPDYDGWKVLEELQALYPALSKKLKVYIITASINPEDKMKAEEYPFVQHFISKPFTKDTLYMLSREMHLKTA